MLYYGGMLQRSVSARGVEATGDPQQFVWTLRRLAGAGPVLSGDQVSLEAAGKYLAVVDDQVVMVASETPESKFILEIKAGDPRHLEQI